MGVRGMLAVPLCEKDQGVQGRLPLWKGKQAHWHFGGT